MATGSGKTWLARRAIRRAVDLGYRAVYLSPIRALADELFPAWQQEFSPHPVGIYTGDYGQPGNHYPVSFSEARILIMTPERLDACTRNWRAHWHWLPDVDLVVVDEMHLLGEQRRGARLEGAIGRLRRLNPFCRFLGLSATLGNREELADWLQGVEYGSDWRAVPLHWRVTRFRRAADKPSLLAAEIERNRAQGGKSLVFAQSRRRCEVLSSYLQTNGIRADHHHAGLSHSARRKVESVFRAADLDALVATGTLEVGLNMPVRQVVLYDTQGFDGTQFIPMSTNTVWQRAGRAGRPGLDPYGEAVLMIPAWEKPPETYLKGKFERIESSLGTPAALAEQVIAEVGSGICRSVTQVQRALGQSLAAFQHHSLPVAETVQAMLAAGMLREVQQEAANHLPAARLAATRLGRIASRQLLQPNTILMTRGFLQAFPHFSNFDVLVLLALTPDCEPVLPADFEELGSLAQQLSGVRGRLGTKLETFRNITQVGSGKRLLSALKMAALLLSWCETGDNDEAAAAYGVYPFELSRLRDSVVRLLSAAAAVANVADSDEASAPVERELQQPAAVQQLRILHTMISAGLPAQAASLAMLEGIGPKWAKKLKSYGIGTLGALARSPVSSLALIPGLSHSRAGKWVHAAAILADAGEPSRQDETPLLIATAGEIQDGDYDPYRMRRARELQVVPSGTDAFVVTGGLEPHRVRRTGAALSCDCPDHAKGHICKHILATRAHVGFAGDHCRRADKAASPDTVDLLQLWEES